MNEGNTKDNQVSQKDLKEVQEQLKRLQDYLKSVQAKDDGDQKSSDETDDNADDKADDKGKDAKDKDDKDGKKPKKLSFKERLKKMSTGQKLGLVAVIVLLVGSGAYFAYGQYKYENTDDAYVQAYSTQIAPKVAGMVTHVLVVENQQVKAGQILVQIDRKDYVAALSDALASRDSLQAQYKNAELNYNRMKMLIRDRAISRQQYDRAESDFHNLEKQTKAAQARVEEAQLNLEYTSVRAPGDGLIARRSVDIGMYASPGMAVLGFVPSDERWVDANFKETQLSSIVPGRPARVTVDAVSGKTYEGVVESVSPATGATFTLLPPDNATGNFTKVVQRIPVRIRLKNLKPEDLNVLQAGLSAEVDIYKHRDAEALPALPAPVFVFDDIHTPPPAITSSGLKKDEQAGISANGAAVIDEDADDAR